MESFCFFSHTNTFRTVLRNGFEKNARRSLICRVLLRRVYRFYVRVPDIQIQYEDWSTSNELLFIFCCSNIRDRPTLVGDVRDRSRALWFFSITHVQNKKSLLIFNCWTTYWFGALNTRAAHGPSFSSPDCPVYSVPQSPWRFFTFVTLITGIDMISLSRLILIDSIPINANVLFIRLTKLFIEPSCLCPVSLRRWTMTRDGWQVSTFSNPVVPTELNSVPG